MRGRAVWLPFVIVTLIWGTTWIVIKGQLGDVPPIWSVCYRFLIGGVTMLGWAAWQRLPLALDRRAFWLVFGLALTQFVLNFNLVYAAEQYVTSGICAVVFALLFIPNALLSHLFFGTHAGRRFWIGSTIAIIGIACLFVHEFNANPVGGDRVLIGIGLTLAGVLCASSANVMQSADIARKSALPVLLGWSMLAGALIDAVAALATVGAPVFSMAPGYVGGVLYLGIVASAVAFSQYFQLIRHIGAARAAYTSVIIPVLAMAISTVAEGYEWSWLAAVGAVIAMAGMVVALQPGKAERTI